MSTLTIEQQFYLKKLETMFSSMSDEQKKTMILDLAKTVLEQQNAFQQYAVSHMFGY